MFVIQGIVQIFTLAGQKQADLMRVSGILTKITHCKYWCYRVSLRKQQSGSDQWKPTERESMLTSCKGNFLHELEITKALDLSREVLNASIPLSTLNLCVTADMDNV